MENYEMFTYTIDEAIEVATRKTRPTASSRREDDGSREKGWSGESFEDAVKMAVEGDPTTAADLRRKLGAMASIQTAPRATRKLDVAGTQVDMSRFLRGDHENMVEVIRARRAAPVLRIAVERAVSSYVTPETIRSVGTSVLAVVENLRTAGVAAEIWVTFSIRGMGGKKSCTQVLIQEAGRPIDVDRLAFWACNPATLRRIAFAIWEQQSAEFVKEYNIFGNYGYPDQTPREDFDEVAPSQAEKVTEWIADVLQRRAGITVLSENEVRSRSDSR